MRELPFSMYLSIKDTVGHSTSYSLHLNLQLSRSLKTTRPNNMAPSLLETQLTAPHHLSNPALTSKSIDRKIFPDGIKTSGQHPPQQEYLKPYSAFPTEITGESVWKAEDYINNPERWVHVFNDEEIGELSATADQFIANNTPLTGISQVRSYSFFR